MKILISLAYINFISSLTPLICKNHHNRNPRLLTRKLSEIVKSQKPIGCCPNTEFGAPYGPEKSCCCDKVYTTNTHFCCQPTGKCDTHASVMKLENRDKCRRIDKCESSIDKRSGEEFHCSNDDNKGSECSLQCREGYVQVGPNGPIDARVAKDNSLLNDGVATKLMSTKNSFSQTVTYKCDSENGINQWQLTNKTARQEICCRPSCPPVPVDTKIDFFIVLDKSSSIGKDNFKFVQTFAKHIIDQMPLGPDNVQMRLTTYNDIVESVFEMNDSISVPKLQLIEKIEAIEYKGKGTMTGDALRDIVDNALFHKDNRPDAKDLLLLVTDGRSKQHKLIRESTRILEENNVRILVIGVGPEIKESELIDIASDDSGKNMRLAKDFEGLVSLGTWVLETQCPDLVCH